MIRLASGHYPVDLEGTLILFVYNLCEIASVWPHFLLGRVSLNHPAPQICCFAPLSLASWFACNHLKAGVQCQ